MRRHLSANNTLITEERKLILSYPILELVRKLRDGDLDPVSVLEAYQVSFDQFKNPAVQKYKSFVRQVRSLIHKIIYLLGASSYCDRKNELCC